MDRMLSDLAAQSGLSAPAKFVAGAGDEDVGNDTRAMPMVGVPGVEALFCRDHQQAAVSRALNDQIRG
jgi:hypothetical protein